MAAKKMISFKDMIDDLVAKGLLDHSRKLTPEGHNYVEEIKKKYKAKTKPFEPDKNVTEPFSDENTDQPVITWKY